MRLPFNGCGVAGASSAIAACAISIGSAMRPVPWRSQASRPAAGPSGNTRSKNSSRELFIKGSGLYGGAELGGLNFSSANKVNAGAYGPSATSGEILDGKVTKPDGLSSLTAALDAMR